MPTTMPMTQSSLSIPRTSRTSLNGTEFVIASQYRITRAIGSGAYGVVAAAEDTMTGKKVAIKKIPKFLNDPVDAKRILREVKLMRYLQHENLVGLYDIQDPPGGFAAGPQALQDVYIISELMDTDMHRVIYSRQVLTDEHIQYFLYQILRGLKYMHSANVLHRDLKPSNILLTANCDLKICDFGLSRGIDCEKLAPLTEYVVTRWYRAPEIMLACRQYTKAVDVWAAGCIFGELIRRKPLFAGNNYMDMLQIITTVLGSPEDADLTSFVDSERALSFMRRNAGKPKTPWSQVFRSSPMAVANGGPGINPLALDLLEKMLVINPKKRITVTEALAHPYLASLHMAEDEPVHEGGPFDFSWENTRLNRETIQRLMWQEIKAFREDQLAKLNGPIKSPTPGVFPDYNVATPVPPSTTPSNTHSRDHHHSHHHSHHHGHHSHGNSHTTTTNNNNAMDPFRNGLHSPKFQSKSGSFPSGTTTTGTTTTAVSHAPSQPQPPAAAEDASGNQTVTGSPGPPPGVPKAYERAQRSKRAATPVTRPAEAFSAVRSGTGNGGGIGTQAAGQASMDAYPTQYETSGAATSVVLDMAGR